MEGREQITMSVLETNEIKELYRRLIEAWNKRDASGMADLFVEEGEMIGFDGSIASGSKGIFSHLEPIFASYPTPPFVSKIKDVRPLGSANAAILRAIVGMVPPGREELEPSLNAHQTLVAVKVEDEWVIELFQNTPARYDGRPELIEQMTNELKEQQ